MFQARQSNIAHRAWRRSAADNAARQGAIQHRRRHESIGNLTPADLDFGCGHDIPSERRKIKEQTLKQRRLLNQRQAS